MKTIGPPTPMDMLRISHRGIQHFQEKKSHCSSMSFEVPHTSPKTKNVQVKTISPPLDMLCIYLPGDKTFSRKKSHRSTVIVKVSLTFPNPIYKSNQLDPYRYASPFGR